MDPGVAVLLGGAVFTVVCGVIAGFIAVKKGRSNNFFFLGLLLGIVGVVITIFISPGHPPPPPGMRAVACARCNAVQNVSETAAEFECWQCKATCVVTV